MANFKQVCRLKMSSTNFQEADIREAFDIKGRKCWIGRISWFDGKDSNDKSLYQWLHFYTRKEEVAQALLSNKLKEFEIEGFIKIKREQNESSKLWKVKPEVHLIRAALCVKDTAPNHYN